MATQERKPGVAFYGKVRYATLGHKKAIDTAKGITDKVGGQLHIGLSGTSEPLTASQKKAHAEAMFQHPVESGSEHTKNLFSYLSHLNQHHDEVHLVAGSDRAPEYRRTLSQWNGRADKSGKVAFNFKKWKVHEVAGKREDSGKHPTKMSRDELEKSASATKVIGLANAGDYEGFKAYHPDMDEKKVKKVYSQIRAGSQLKEHADIGELNHERFGPMLDTFTQFAAKKLGIQSMPTMELSKDDLGTSFGGYNPATKSIVISTKNRHPMDVYRTVAHELVHHKQNEDGRLGNDIKKEGSTGSDWENEANAHAGMIMRWFAKKNPDAFKTGHIVEAYMNEGLQDPARKKAVFLFGGPGSGKDFIMQRTLMGHGLREINSDTAFEAIMKKRGLSFKMPPEEQKKRDIARGVGKTATRKKQDLSVAGGQGIIVNGTGDDPEKISAIKKHLEDNGYDTSGVFVHTADEVSRERNQARERTVPEDVRKAKWQAVQDARPELQKMFGTDKFHHVDNSEDYRTVSHERKEAIDKEHLGLFKKIRQFTTAQTEKPESIEKEKQKRGITKFTHARATKTSQKQAKPAPYKPSASELEQAKRLGVQHVGDGMFGSSKDKATLVSRGGQLFASKLDEARKMKGKDPCWKGYQMVGKKMKNGHEVPNCVPVDEAFESFIKENKPSDREWGTNSLTNIYKKDTPGQSDKKVVKKKLKQEDTTPALGYEFGNNGIGPTFGVVRSPNGLGTGYSMPMTSMAESVQKWAAKPSTIDRFTKRYGNLAEQKIYEAALKLNEMDIQPRSFTSIRENWEALGGRDSGTVAKQSKEELNERGADSKGLYRSTESGAGLTAKGAKHFGVKTAVTTPPSKLKSGSKAAKRRKSFCARMGGMKGPMKDEKGRPTRKAMSLRRWNCEE